MSVQITWPKARKTTLHFSIVKDKSTHESRTLLQHVILEWLSIVIDGADQTFTMPRFVVSTKDQRGHVLKGHLIGSASETIYPAG